MTDTLEREPGIPAESEGRSRRLRPWTAVVAGLVVVLAGSVFVATRPAGSSVSVVDEAGLAAELGIEVKLVAVSAGGGLVDFRFRILDASKAQAIFDGLYPSVISTGGTVLPSDLSRHGRIVCKTGETHFILYANSGTAVRVGQTVSVQIGDFRIDNIAVQG